jgi:hypothetical protein
MGQGKLMLDVRAAQGIQMCLLQMIREARAMGLTFAAAHMDVAVLEIADALGSAQPGFGGPRVANDDGQPASNKEQA